MYRQDNEFSQVMGILAELGIENINYHFEGSGDSGNFEFQSIKWKEGAEEIDLSAFPYRHPYLNLMDYLYERAEKCLEGGWEIDNGSYGEVDFWPNAKNEEFVDVEFNEYNDDDYDYDEEQEEDELRDPAIARVSFSSDTIELTDKLEIEDNIEHLETPHGGV